MGAELLPTTVHGNLTVTTNPFNKPDIIANHIIAKSLKMTYIMRGTNIALKDPGVYLIRPSGGAVPHNGSSSTISVSTMGKTLYNKNYVIVRIFSSNGTNKYCEINGKTANSFTATTSTTTLGNGIVYIASYNASGLHNISISEDNGQFIEVYRLFNGS